jgi:hypothetical protein
MDNRINILKGDRVVEQGCKCQKHNGRYNVDLMVPDWLWKKIATDPNSMYCGSCIMQMIEDYYQSLGEFSYFVLLGKEA